MRNPVIGRVSSEYALKRKHPVTGVITSHVGIDIAAPQGTKIRAAFSGRVIAVRSDSYPGDKTGYMDKKTGNYILIRNSDGACQYYGHPKDVFVKIGDWVNESNVIGTVGATGNVTGSHLHFETWKTDDWLTYFNPRALFNKYKVVPGVDNPQRVYYVVKRGDTLTSIGERFSVSIHRLKLRNNIQDVNKIYAGQKLWVTND